MTTETEDPQREPRGVSRIEVWLFVAAGLVGLLGFMATLSTGDVEGVAGSDEPEAAVSTRETPGQLK